MHMYKEGDLTPLVKDQYREMENKGVGKAEIRVRCATDSAICNMVVKNEQGEKAYTESNLMLRLAHPNIIRCRDVFDQDGKIHMILENAEGQSLARLIDTCVEENQPLTEYDCMKYFAHMLVAVKEIHDQDIIHTQISTENLLLKQAGRKGYVVKLANFAAAQQGKTGKAQGSGERKYLAPEVLMGGQYTKGADIWALGLVLYQLASLSFPFTSQDFAGIISELKEGKHIKLPRGFSPRIKAIINRMLKPDPQERATIDSLLAEPQLHLHVTEWVNSSLFQAFFRESYVNRIIMNEAKHLFLLKPEVSNKYLDIEYREYVKRVARPKRNILTWPSECPCITVEQFNSQFERLKVLDYDDRGNFQWTVLKKKNNQILQLKMITIGNKSPQEKSKIENRIKALANVKHPCLLNTLEYFFSDSEIYLIQENCDQGNLAADLTSRITYVKAPEDPDQTSQIPAKRCTTTAIFYSEEAIMKYFTQIACGLKIIHDAGLVHQNLSSQQILMYGKTVKLSGFELFTSMVDSSKDALTYKQKYRELRNQYQSNFQSIYEVIRIEDGHIFQAKRISHVLTEQQKRLQADNVKRLVNLKHTNIIAYEEFFYENDELILIVEKCNWTSLKEHIELQKQEDRFFRDIDIVNLLHQTALALAYANEQNLFHLDIQPNNLLVSALGELKIANFGMTLITNESQILTKVGENTFISPEESGTYQMSHKQDVWCLGATFLEAFTMNQFRDQFMKRMVKETIISLSKLPPTFEKRLHNLLKRMLDQNQSARPDAREITQESIVQEYFQAKYGLQLLENADRIIKISSYNQTVPTTNDTIENSLSNQQQITFFTEMDEKEIVSEEKDGSICLSDQSNSPTFMGSASKWSENPLISDDENKQDHYNTCVNDRECVQSELYETFNYLDQEVKQEKDKEQRAKMDKGADRVQYHIERKLKHTIKGMFHKKAGNADMEGLQLHKAKLQKEAGYHRQAIEAMQAHIINMFESDEQQDLMETVIEESGPLITEKVTEIVNIQEQIENAEQQTEVLQRTITDAGTLQPTKVQEAIKYDMACQEAQLRTLKAQKARIAAEGFSKALKVWAREQLKRMYASNKTVKRITKKQKGIKEECTREIKLRQQRATETAQMEKDISFIENKLKSTLSMFAMPCNDCTSHNSSYMESEVEESELEITYQRPQNMLFKQAMSQFVLKNWESHEKEKEIEHQKRWGLLVESIEYNQKVAKYEQKKAEQALVNMQHSEQNAKELAQTSMMTDAEFSTNLEMKKSQADQIREQIISKKVIISSMEEKQETPMVQEDQILCLKEKVVEEMRLQSEAAAKIKKGLEEQIEAQNAKLAKLMHYIKEADNIQIQRKSERAKLDVIKNKNKKLLRQEHKKLLECIAQNEAHDLGRQKVWQIDLDLKTIFMESPIDEADLKRVAVLSDKIEQLQKVKEERKDSFFAIEDARTIEIELKYNELEKLLILSRICKSHMESRVEKLEDQISSEENYIVALKKRLRGDQLTPIQIQMMKKETQDKELKKEILELERDQDQIFLQKINSNIQKELKEAETYAAMMISIEESHAQIKMQDDEEINTIDNLPRMKKALFKKLINRVRKSQSLYHLDDSVKFLRRNSILRESKQFVENVLNNKDQDARTLAMLRKPKYPAKSDDILSLGAILYEMAALYPSLTLLYRADAKNLSKFPRLPQGNYSLEFKEIMKWIFQIDLAVRPKIDEVITKLHTYACTFNTDERAVLNSLMNDIQPIKSEEIDKFAADVVLPPARRSSSKQHPE